MKIENKIILLFIYGIFSLIIFIIQCKHSSEGQYSSEKLKEYINNWKLNPIIDISDSSNHYGYSEKDYSIIKGKKIYFKRMKNYNFAKIKVQEKNLINPQICGTDELKNDILFPYYEECPINYLVIKKSCDSQIKKCIKLGDDDYLIYSNQKIENKIIVEVKDESPTGYLGINKNNNIPSNFENIVLIPKKLKIKNILALIFSIIFVPTIIMSIYILISIILGHNIYEIKLIIKLPLFFFIFIGEFLLICYILGAIWINEGTNILNSIGLNALVMKKRIFNCEMTNIFFSFILMIAFFFVNFSFNAYLDYYEKKGKEIFLKLNAGVIIIGILLIPVIFLGINLSKKPFYNGFIKDLSLNYQMSPITQIDISEKSTIENDLDSSYFDPKVPYKLGKIIRKNDNSKIEKNHINSWKGKYFYITRMNSYLIYPKIFSKYNKYDKNEAKICGKDSKGNDLYFPSNEYCPINDIKITSSSEPPNNDFNWTSKQIDSSTYMHYTNDNNKGEILVHLRISISKPMADINSYNEICYKLYGIDKCKHDNNYHGYDNDVYGYEKLDSSNSREIEINTNETINLYKRTYSGLNQETDFYIGEEIFGIKKFLLTTHIISLIFYIISLCCILLIIYFMIYKDLSYSTWYFQISFFGFIFSFITFVLEIIVFIRVKKIKKNIFDNSDYDAKLDFIKYPLFYKLDIGVFVYITIILIINLILSIIFFYQRKSMFSHETQNAIKEFLISKNYLAEIIFALIILLILIIIFPTLLLFNGLYEEGYVNTLIKK